MFRPSQAFANPHVATNFNAHPPQGPYDLPRVQSHPSTNDGATQPGYGVYPRPGDEATQAQPFALAYLGYADLGAAGHLAATHAAPQAACDRQPSAPATTYAAPYARAEPQLHPVQGHGGALAEFAARDGAARPAYSVALPTYGAAAHSELGQYTPWHENVSLYAQASDAYSAPTELTKSAFAAAHAPNVPLAPQPTSALLRLSLRGTEVVLPRDLIDAMPANSKLALLADDSDVQPQMYTADGALYLARNPETFHRVIDFYVSGRKLPASLGAAELSALRAEAKYLRLPDLTLECKVLYPLREQSRAARRAGDVQAELFATQLLHRALLQAGQVAEAERKTHKTDRLRAALPFHRARTQAAQLPQSASSEESEQFAVATARAGSTGTSDVFRGQATASFAGPAGLSEASASRRTPAPTGPHDDPRGWATAFPAAPAHLGENALGLSAAPARGGATHARPMLTHAPHRSASPYDVARWVGGAEAPAQSQGPGPVRGRTLSVLAQHNVAHPYAAGLASRQGAPARSVASTSALAHRRQRSQSMEPQRLLLRPATRGAAPLPPISAVVPAPGAPRLPSHLTFGPTPTAPDASSPDVCGGAAPQYGEVGVVAPRPSVPGYPGAAPRPAQLRPATSGNGQRSPVPNATSVAHARPARVRDHQRSDDTIQAWRINVGAEPDAPGAGIQLSPPGFAGFPSPRQPS